MKCIDNALCGAYELIIDDNSEDLFDVLNKDFGFDFRPSEDKTEVLDKIKDYKHLYSFIKNHYYPYCRNEIGLCYIQNGKEIYSNLLKQNIGFLEITPEEIHNLGLNLLKDYKKSKKKNFYKSREEMFNDCLKYANIIYNELINK